MQCLGTRGVDLSVAVNISDFLGSDLTLLRIHDGLHRIFYIVPLMVIDVVIQIKIQLKLLLQMQKLWNELEEAYKQAKISEESVKTAEENVRLSTDYYQVGTETLSDLLNAQSLLQQSRDQYTDDYTNYLIKRTEYLQATGR